eukprot:361354-Chlamydomonas_euryale.AAC.6
MRLRTRAPSACLAAPREGPARLSVCPFAHRDALVLRAHEAAKAPQQLTQDVQRIDCLVELVLAGQGATRTRAHEHDRG